MTILPIGGELLHADKQTEMKKITVDFLRLASAPKLNDIHDIKAALLELYFSSVAVTVHNSPV